MKHLKIESLLVFLLGILLLTIGCNMDYDGIFLRVTQSEETVDVGKAYIAGGNGTDLFVYTTNGGMQTYTTASEEWNKIDTSATTTTPILSNLISSDGTNIYFATRSGENENNAIYTFAMATPTSITPYSAGYDVISMSAQNDLMLTKDSATGNFYVREISSVGTIRATLAGYDAATLLSQDNTWFMVSAYTMVNDEKQFSHHLYKGSTEITLTGITDEYGVRAFYIDTVTQNLAVLTSDGSLYYDVTFNTSGTTSTLAKGDDTISLATTTLSESPLPVITNYNSDLFYIQGKNNYLYSLNTGTGAIVDVTNSFATNVSAITITSYFWNGSEGYAGTVDNGIHEITF